MIIAYDIKLIALSVFVAILASHAGMLVFAWDKETPKLSYKIRVGLGALIIGGGIWTMHFIGMLALHMPLEVNYAVFPTLTSILVAIILTGLGLYVATAGILPRFGLPTGALVMGMGIAAMHYVGMDALSSVCQLTYEPFGIVLAITLGVSASFLSLWMATRPSKTTALMISAAVMLGFAISSMHYTAIYFTKFDFPGEVLSLPIAALSNTYLACILAVTTFVLVNLFLLISLPGQKTYSDDYELEKSGTSPKFESTGSNNHELESIPYVRLTQNGETRYIDASNILYITAEGHYTRIGYVSRANEFCEKFCDRRLSDLKSALANHYIMQCHRSHLVNLKHIRAIQRFGERGEVLFEMDQTPKIPISRKTLTAFAEAADQARFAI